MRFVLEVIYDETSQRCTKKSCGWKGAMYDEPFRLCPVCFSVLAVVNVNTGEKQVPAYDIRDYTDRKFTCATYLEP